RSEPGGRRGPDRDDSAAEAVPGAGDGERRPRVGLAVEEQDAAVRRERDAGELAAVEGVAGERERPVLAGGADEVLLAVAVLGQDDAAAVRGDGDVVGAVEAAARLEDELELDLVAARVVGPDLAGVVPGGALVRARVAGDEVRLAVAPPGAFELLAAGDLTVLELLADGGLPGQRVGDVDPPGRQPGAGFGDERQVGDAGDLQRLQLPAGPVGVVAAAARAREEPEEQPERPGRVLGEVGDVGVRVDGDGLVREAAEGGQRHGLGAPAVGVDLEDPAVAPGLAVEPFGLLAGQPRPPRGAAARAVHGRPGEADVLRQQVAVAVDLERRGAAGGGGVVGQFARRHGRGAVVALLVVADKERVGAPLGTVAVPLGAVARVTVAVARVAVTVTGVTMVVAGVTVAGGRERGHSVVVAGDDDTVGDGVALHRHDLVGETLGQVQDALGVGDQGAVAVRLPRVGARGGLEDAVQASGEGDGQRTGSAALDDSATSHGHGHSFSVRGSRRSLAPVPEPAVNDHRPAGEPPGHSWAARSATSA